MSRKSEKYPAIEAALRRYRGEEKPAGSVTCPGCALVFVPEEGKSEPAAPSASERLNTMQRKKREAKDKKDAAFREQMTEDDRRTREHRDHARRERDAKAAPRSFAQIAVAHYGPAESTAGEAVIPTSPRGGK